ncbi:hypothetical protein H4R33_002794 [Dimargaris cristalligena]|nr:hypothetical protein H4R33_002794 [Dimargaris cristalligena]
MAENQRNMEAQHVTGVMMEVPLGQWIRYWYLNSPIADTFESQFTGTHPTANIMEMTDPDGQMFEEFSDDIVFEFM